MNVTLLEWDTEFFDYRIGRAEIAAPLTIVAAEAEQLRLDCVYVESPSQLDADGLDLRLVDERVLLCAALDGAAAAPGSVRDASADDIEHLDPVLDRLAPWSRFARDERFGLDAARRMYERWLQRAFTADNERVGVLENGAGFVTVRTTDEAEIGLIGAATDGSGAGRALIEWAKAVAAPAPMLTVVTQADNTRARDLYERSGFAPVTTTLMYHLWLSGG